MPDSWWDNQVSYHQGPDPGLWNGPFQHPPRLWTVEREEAGTVHPKLQNPQHRVAIEYPRRVPVKIQYWYRPMTHCTEHLQVKMYGLKFILCDSLGRTITSTVRFFFNFWNKVASLFKLLPGNSLLLRQQRASVRKIPKSHVQQNLGKSKIKH